MRTILVSLAHLDRMDESHEATITIARQNDGYVIGYYPILGASLIVYASPEGGFPVDDNVKRLYEERLPDVKVKFEDRMRRSGVKYEWREDERFAPRLTKAILEHGREADLIIMGHDAPGSKYASEEAGFIADIVLGAGRPVLVLPPLQGKTLKLDKVAIGWNASREACRAAFDSLPLLEEAGEVFLEWVNPEKKPDKAGKLPGAELATALARHDVMVTTKSLSNRNRKANALMNYIQEDNIDLLFMGAYGQCHLREQILGGVTEHILKNLPSPVLLSNQFGVYNDTTY